MKNALNKRMVKYMGRRTMDFMSAGYEEVFTEDEKKLAKAACGGEVELTKELEAVYSKAVRPIREVTMKNGEQTYTKVLSLSDNTPIAVDEEAFKKVERERELKKRQDKINMFKDMGWDDDVEYLQE